MSRPSFENLRCFLAAAEQLNFRRAAAAVALTPAAFSQRIKQLEDELGARLFDRSSRHVALTEQGQALRPRALEAVAALERCGDLRPGTSRFSLGTRFELGMSWIVPTLIALGSDAGPGPGAAASPWEVDLVFGSANGILARLEQGTLDAVVTSSPVAREDWVASVLHPESYVLVAAPSLLAATPLQTTADAARHTLLDIDATLPLGRYLLSAHEGIAFLRTRICGTAAAVIAFAVAGHGAAVLPTYSVREQLTDGSLAVVLEELPLLRDSFRLLYRANSPLAGALANFADHLRTRPLR